jgi:glycosyltransferase involved in cell wall biosynthesis
MIASRGGAGNCGGGGFVLFGSSVDITVVIAAHDEEKTLPRCLASLAACEKPGAVEIIVVDNASTDGTAQVAASLGARVVPCATPGAVHAKTAGVATARGSIVAVIDADSTCPSDWLQKIARAFADDALLVGLSGPARYRNPRRWVRAVMWLWYGWWKLWARVFGNALYAVGTNVAFRRDAYEKAGGFDRNILVGGDEVGFFNKLRRVGRTRYTDELWVETDARRTERGFWRFFFSTVLLHYVFNYTFYRITGRSLLKRYQPGSTLSR